MCQHFCQVCDAPASWLYMPSDGSGVFCEEHVPRGCSCNVDPITGIEDTDEQGRLLPCCEYMWLDNL